MKIIRTIIFLAFLPCLLFVAMTAHPAWAREKALAEITTKAGRLVLVEKDGEKMFLLNEKVIFSGSPYLRIQRFIRPRQAYDGLVVKDFTGPVYCPARYRLLIFKQEGGVQALPEFNHCHPKPNISLKGQTITFTFPDFGSQKQAVWTYNGDKLMEKSFSDKPKTSQASKDKTESKSGDPNQP